MQTASGPQFIQDEALDLLNLEFGSSYELHTPWHQIFVEEEEAGGGDAVAAAGTAGDSTAAAAAGGAGTLMDAQLPSEDEEDSDFEWAPALAPAPYGFCLSQSAVAGYMACWVVLCWALGRTLTSFQTIFINAAPGWQMQMFAHLVRAWTARVANSRRVSIRLTYVMTDNILVRAVQGQQPRWRRQPLCRRRGGILGLQGRLCRRQRRRQRRQPRSSRQRRRRCSATRPQEAQARAAELGRERRRGQVADQTRQRRRRQRQRGQQPC